MFEDYFGGATMITMLKLDFLNVVGYVYLVTPANRKNRL